MGALIIKMGLWVDYTIAIEGPNKILLQKILTPIS